MHAAGTGFPQWFQASAARLYVRVEKAQLASLASDHAEGVAATIAAADDILAHRFNLLGSGPFVPRDANRSPNPSGYQPIDWDLDPVRGLSFPRGIHHKEWDAPTVRPSTADIKYPWELAQCQHWPVLGQAWLLTGDRRYALEIQNELEDFVAANPAGFGVNWVCTMDVALRALNWAIALQIVRDCLALDEAFWRRAYAHLYEHAAFIFANLENKYETTSNHFLSNVVGLFYLSAVFREFDGGRVWNEFCRDSLEREMVVQVLRDGADYESSVAYHRFVLELFLGAARLADWRGEPLSVAYRAKLTKMVDFLAGVLRPDGLMPQIGDADDGRLHILSGYGSWKPQDARHIFAPAALLLSEPRWLNHCGPVGAWEAAWWGFDISRVIFHDGPPPDIALLFPDAGLAIARKGGTYLAVTNGVVGTNGFGNHKHNDQLGFEFHAGGQPLFVDPGSFVYTSDPDARNLFRGTGYHNTVMVDRAEQNELRPDWLFRLFETAHAEHIWFKSEGATVEYCGRHVGYTRLTTPLVHERAFSVSLDVGALRIIDRLEGSGPHELVWHFHLAPGIAVTQESDERVLLEIAGDQYAMDAPTGLRARTYPAWYSPSYGVRIRCTALEWHGKMEIGAGRRFQFTVSPAAKSPSIPG